MTLTSFGKDLNTAVFGASGGIGSALVEALRADPSVAQVHAVSRGGEGDLTCDYHDENSIAAVADSIAAQGPVHVAIIALGILHSDAISPEKSYKTVYSSAMAETYAINTIAPTMIAKHMLPKLAKSRKSAFGALSARVGSISDNRLGGWLSYRASKAALNMSIRTLSIELARMNPDALIVGLHPGTVATALSQPFQHNVPEGKLFTPSDSARRLLETLDGASTEDSGSVLAYDGSTIPP